MARKSAYDEAPERQQPSSLPSIPETCGVHDCTCPLAVLSVTVRTHHGELRTGGASRFGKLGGKGHPYALNSEFQFVEWVARCADHFLRDQVRLGKDRFAPIRADGKMGSEGTNPILDGEHTCECEIHRRISEERPGRFQNIMSSLAQRLTGNPRADKLAA